RAATPTRNGSRSPKLGRTILPRSRAARTARPSRGSFSEGCPGNLRRSFMAGVLIPGVRIKGAPRIRIVGLRVDAHLSSLLLVTGAFGRPGRIVKLIGHEK